MNKIIFSFIFILGVFTACSDKQQPIGPDDTSTVSKNPVTVENSDIVFSGLSDHGTLSFTSEKTWIIDVSDTKGTPDWFTVSRKSGDQGSSVIDVNVTGENPYSEDRNAFIRIKSSGHVSLVTVTQKKKDALIASKDNIWLDSKAQSFGIDMQNNSDYGVFITSVYGIWISRQQNSNKESFDVNENTSLETRTGNIVFYGGGKADTVFVYQKKKDRTFLPSYDIALNPTRTILPITVENREFKVRIEGGGWINQINASQIGKAPRVDKAYFEIDPNTDGASRSVKIIFTDLNAQLSDTISVTQFGIWELVYYPKGDYTAEAEGEVLTAQISKDSEYSIKVPTDFSSWLSAGERTPGPDGNSPDFLTVTIKPNTTNYVRRGYVLLQTLNSSLTDTILIKQACKPDNRGALISFYEATNGNQWTNNANWCSEKPLNQWYGITTDAQGKVTKIELSGNNLSGKVIDYSVDLLENLEKLDVSDNKLTGVTSRIGSSKTLRYFDISHNEIRSTFPEELLDLILDVRGGVCYIKDMEKFCVNDNYYYGDLPLFFIQAVFGDDGKYFFDAIKQKGPGFKASINVGLGYSFPDILYTDIDNGQFELKDFCSRYNYTILFRSKNAGQETINSLKKLNTISLSSIPNYKIGVIWDAVDTGLSEAELNNIRQTYQLDFTIVNAASGQLREKFKFGEQSEFYLSRTDAGMMKFNYDVQPVYDFLLPSDLYFSSDYSKDKTYRTVQLATVGRGVDIVFAGDGFTDQDIAAGKYDIYAEAAFEAFFALEPLKSLRERFNCYIVYAVSRNNDYSHPSYYNAFGARPDASAIDLHLDSYTYDVVPEYARCAPIHDFNTTTVMIAVNYPKKSLGVAVMAHTFGIAYVTTGPDFEEYKDVMLHEMGHAFGKLSDEYASNPDPISEGPKATHIWLWEQYELDGNIDFTNDLTQIKWKHFIGIPKYSYVGAFEGASYHMKGVWRPEVLSIMRAPNYLYFNAPSREQLYKRTIILSGDTYSFEDFVAQDNVTPPPLLPGVKSTSPKAYLTPPIIITDTK